MKKYLSLDFSLSPDGVLLFATRMVRVFAYGMISVILVLYLTQLGLTAAQVGILFTLTMVGDVVISLWIALTADHTGRKKMLMMGAALMILAGIVFYLTHDFFLLLIAATIGVISPSAGEVGPFLSIELASLSHITPNEKRTKVLAWYNLLASVATALGSFGVGAVVQALEDRGRTPLQSYQVIVLAYAVIGIFLMFLFSRLSRSVEVHSTQKLTSSFEKKFLGLHRSQKMVFKMSCLFSLDSFAGGFVFQSLTAYWFTVHFGTSPAMLGTLFFCTNILAGISSLVSAALAARIGLIQTMVFTHIPANIFLILVPLMPNLPLAVTFFLLRACLSSMDVPARQSYTMAVVDPDERSATAGITNVSRNIGASLSGLFLKPILGHGALFFLGGGIKIIYDLALYFLFRGVKPPEEKNR